ncbi:hypothetical protein ACFL6U_27530 [Planctomycetota bacterium]
MAKVNDIRALVKKLRYDTSLQRYDRIFDAVLQAHEQFEEQKAATMPPTIGRILMKNKFAGLAAVAVILLASVFLMSVFDKSMPTAYAIDQTIQASHSVQYLHIRAITPSHEDYPVDFWVEFAPDGRPKNMRLNLPDWMAPGGGPREVVWKDGKKQEWLKEKNILTISDDEASAAQVVKMIENLDPKLAVTRLQEKQRQGLVVLEIDEPTDLAESIVVTATSTEEDDSSFQRKILYVDQATRLVNSIEVYKLINGEYEYAKSLAYYDYNQPIDANLFILRDVSHDAEQVDLMTMGLGQGSHSHEEIAAEVVRQFFMAVMAGDYDKASALFPGVDASGIEEMFDRINIIRIVSIGEPIPERNCFRVPFEVEVEEDGKTSLLKKEGPLVQHLAGQTDRWAILGDFK